MVDVDVVVVVVVVVGLRGGGGRLARGGRRRGTVELLDQRRGALVDEGLELGDGDVGEGEVEDFVGLRGERGEVAVEEDGVEDACVTGCGLSECRRLFVEYLGRDGKERAWARWASTSWLRPGMGPR